jgi:hypothetical protein
VTRRTIGRLKKTLNPMADPVILLMGSCCANAETAAVVRDQIVQVDAALGDRHPGDGRVETFNPLFPNGCYFTLAGYTGYANMIHVEASITLRPTNSLTLLGALGFQWRETTTDPVYQQANDVVPGTAGHPLAARTGAHRRETSS